MEPLFFFKPIGCPARPLINGCATSSKVVTPVGAAIFTGSLYSVFFTLSKFACKVASAKLPPCRSPVATSTPVSRKASPA